MVRPSGHKIKRKAVVLGTGGHSRVVLSLLFSQNKHEVISLFELGEFRTGETIMGMNVSHFPASLNELKKIKNLDIFLAVGCNKKRKHYWEIVSKEGFNTPNLISETASIDASVKLGEANVICSNVFLGPCAQLGNNNLINTGSIMEHEARVGSHSHLAPRSVLAGRSTIHDSCFIGAGATIIDYLDVVSHTTLGAGATLIKCVSKSGQTLVGVPARSVSKRK